MLAALGGLYTVLGVPRAAVGIARAASRNDGSRRHGRVLAAYAGWLEDRGWKDMLKLQDLKECFNGLADSVVKSTSKWKKWYDETIPELEDIPMGFQEKLSPMQRLWHSPSTTPWSSAGRCP